MTPRSAALILAALLLAAPAAAQSSGGHFWGGADSPGGLFGGFGDPTRLDADRDSRVTHDEVWSWLRQRFTEADGNGDRRLSAEEVTPAARRSPAFRAADTDGDHHLSEEELRMIAGMWFRARDRNRDGALTGDEMPRRRAPAR